LIRAWCAVIVNSMKTILPYIQIILSVLLITAVLLQQRGTGLSAAFGGEGNVYRTKRGFEKVIFGGTIVLSILFFAAAVATVLIR